MQLTPGGKFVIQSNEIYQMAGRGKDESSHWNSRYEFRSAYGKNIIGSTLAAPVK